MKETASEQKRKICSFFQNQEIPEEKCRARNLNLRSNLFGHKIITMLQHKSAEISQPDH